MLMAPSYLLGWVELGGYTDTLGYTELGGYTDTLGYTELGGYTMLGDTLPVLLLTNERWTEPCTATNLS